MTSRRVSRVEEACREELSEILQREIKDPRIGFATITRVRLTDDLRHAQIFVSVLGSCDDVEKTFEGLECAKGWIRSHLGRHLRLKFLPDLDFIYDNSSARAIELEKKFSESKSERSGHD